jgi:hypothetical protein
MPRGLPSADIMRMGLGAPTAVIEKITTATGAAARSAAIAVSGPVLLQASTDCYILFGDSTVTVTANTGMDLIAGEKLLFSPPDQSAYISVLAATTAGYLKIIKVE